MLLEIFYEDRPNNLYKRAHKRMGNITAYKENFLLVHFNVCTKYDEMSIHFRHGQKHVTNSTWYK